MSFIGNMFDPSKGAGYQAQGANIQGVDGLTGQISGATDATNNSIGQQQSFVNALAGQGGIGNQSSVFGQQQDLANQLAQQAAGGGPNPALAQLNQTTGQNVANQAALMAGQRGASSNAGLMARQAAQQGAGIQQQAVGQAATMRAQQQLAAQQALQQQQAQMANLATNQVGQQAGALGQLQAARMGQQNSLMNQMNAQNASNVQMQGNINAANADVAKGNQSQQGGILGGAASALGGLIPLAAMLHNGGMVAPHYADGGEVSGPSSTAGKILKGAGDAFTNFSTGYNNAMQPNGGNPYSAAVNKAIAPHAPAIPAAPQPQQMAPIYSQGPSLGVLTQSQQPMGQNQNVFGVQTQFSQGGKVPAMVSPGEIYLPPSEVEKVAQGKKDPMKAGEKIPGKAKVSGAKNSLKNDTVPKTLEEGGIVLPRSVTQAKHPHWEAKKFVEAIMAKQSLTKAK